MTQRPYVSFAEVKEKVPIPDALAALGILDRFERRGDTLQGVCPLPSHHHGPRPNAEQFKVNRRDGLWLWHCFGDCARGGDVIELVKLMTGYDNSHVRFWFCDYFADRLSLSKKNGSTPVEKDTAREVSTRDTAQAAPKAPSNLPVELPAIKPLRFHLNLDPDVRYLRQRGVTAETAQRYGIGLCRRGVLKGYLAMPVFGDEANGNPIGYLGRWPGDDFDESRGRPRYKFPDEFPRNRVLFGLQLAARSPSEGPLVVVEGPFSVFHLFQCGVTSAVATLGAALSDEQAKLLAGLKRPIIMAFDGDDAGRKGMQLALEKLAPTSYVRATTLADRMQPTDLSEPEVRNLFG